MIGPAAAAVASVPRPAFPPRLGLALAVLAISWAAILTRWAQAPPLVVGAWRLALGSLLFAGVAAAGRVSPLRGWTRRRLLAGAAAAACLAAHFGLWIASLDLTSVASSVVLVTTQPVFTAILGSLFLAERVGAYAAAGIGLALCGSVVITGGDLRLAGGAWRGDLLAVAGAIAIAVYFIIVRRLRAGIDVLPFVTLVTPLAAALMFLAALVAGDPLFDYSVETYGIFSLLALGPTAIGHTLFDWALRYRKAFEVNVAVLGEPLGATLLALLLFGERPGTHVLIGGILVLAGILLAWKSPERPGPPRPACAISSAAP